MPMIIKLPWRRPATKHLHTILFVYLSIYKSIHPSVHPVTHDEHLSRQPKLIHFVHPFCLIHAIIKNAKIHSTHPSIRPSIRTVLDLSLDDLIFSISITLSSNPYHSSPYNIDSAIAITPE